MDEFVQNSQEYFEGSYQSFLEFGGPSVYFHEKCLQECQDNFLSDRHVELIYATLTSWGMHRMGKPEGKLTNWNDFYDSICCNKEKWNSLRNFNVADPDLTEEKYNKILQSLKNEFLNLKVSRSNQTIVAHSKALFHILPNLIPPIDRQHTIRFFTKNSQEWFREDGKFKAISNLPSKSKDQFDVFCRMCIYTKQLGDKLSWKFNSSSPKNVYPLKAIDNAIVNCIKVHRQRRVGGARR